MTDLAKIVVTAEDKTGPALKSAGDSMKQVELTASSLRGVMSGLAGILSVGMFTAMVREAINAADAMDELSQKTGMAVRELSKWDYILKREGVGHETFSRAIKDLNKNLLLAGDSASKSASLMRELGVDVTQGASPALLRIAGIFAELPDGATKSALAVQLFGKSGLEMIPMLNNGTQGIRGLMQEAEKLGRVLDDETAKAAAQFNDDLSVLRAKGDALSMEMMKQLMPSLSRIAEAMREAAKESGLLTAAWVGLGGVASEALGLNDSEEEKFSKRVRQMQDEIETLRAIGDRELTTGIFDRSGTARIKILQEELRVMHQLRDAQKGMFDDQVARMARQGVVLAPAGDRVKDNLESRLKTLLTEGDGARQAELIAKRIEAQRKELDGVLSKIAAKALDIDPDFVKQMGILAVGFTTGKLEATEYGNAVMRLIAMQKPYVDAAALARKQTDELNEANRKADKEYRKIEASAKLYVEGIESEIAALALSNTEREVAIRLRDLENLGIKNGTAKYAELAPRIRAAVEEMERQRAEMSVWGELSDRGAQFFTDLLFDGRSTFKSLGEEVRNFGKEVANLFARRFILNMGAQLTGNNALAALAGQQGQGSLAGSLLNALSGGGSGGSLLGNLLGIGGSMAGSMGAGIAGFGNLIGSSSLASFGSGMASVNAGVSMAGMGGAGGLGASVGNFMAAAGPWVAAIAAIYALHKAFGDKGENWKGQLGFGSAANAYTTQGVFGVEGFANLQGNDATNRSIQAFMAGTGGIDKLLAGSLSGGQMSAIQAQLQGYNRRTDGQPAEFAFGKDDKTAAAQLTLEYLKVKYGAVFDQIDSTFADYVRQYTGTSETLVQEIGVFADLISQLAGTSIKGLSLANLRAMQAEGEELGATLQRLGQGMALVNSIGVEQTDEFLTALRFVQDEFAAAGVTLPVSVDSYRQLREQIDFSTESGRAMYDMLVRVAPAMQSIEQATAAMLASFNQNLAAIFGNASSRASIEGQAIPLVQRFQALTGLLGGQNPLDVFKGIAGSSAGELTNIFNTYGGEAAGLLNQILELYRQYIAIQEQVNTTTQTTGLVMSNNNTVFTTFVDNMGEARASLQRYLAGSLLNQQLSPLTLQQQKEFAKQEFERLALLAPGSADAMNQLGGARDAYLSLLRQLEGSGAGYNAEFFRTFDVTRGIAGGGPTWQSLMQSALPSQGARMASDQDVAALRQDIQQLTLALLQGDRETAERISEALEQQTEKLTLARMSGGPMGMNT